MNVLLVGQGYVGLPVSMAAVSAGFHVTGFDTDPAKTDLLTGGGSHVEDIPSATVRAALDSGRYRVVSDTAELNGFDVAVITVPPPLTDGIPDLGAVEAAAAMVGGLLTTGGLVVLESTTWPGTTTEIVGPILEAKSGLRAGVDFHLGYSPERIDPGNATYTLETTPKVVSGIDAESLARVQGFYDNVVDRTVPVRSPKEAELTKLLENTFRMVNIGMVNEMALMCKRLGVDVWEVIDAAASKPFGFMKFTPGPGLGGHCIPIDPLYLSWKLHALKYTARFIELASEINSNMPRHVISLVMDGMNSQGKALKDNRVLVLGAAYKPDIDDLRESPALDVITLLKEKGALVLYHDPYIAQLHHDGWDMISVPDLMAAVRAVDCVVIITNHSTYDYPAILDAAKLVVDTRNALGKLGKDNPKVFRL